MSRPTRALTGIKVRFRNPATRHPGVVVRCGQGPSANKATEMFLPSYADFHFDDLERRQDPVEDIVVTDEEVKNMFPSS